jgi:hypothetical protein
MQPYVICKGDYLLKLAYQFGFDADTVWNDPSNATLQQLRPDPNILFAGDVLYIPDQTDKPLPAFSLTPGSTNNFVADAPTVTVTLTFSDSRCASQACTIPELPELTGLTTDNTGLLSLTLPVSIDTYTVNFTDAGLSFSCGLGLLDPITTLSGIVQRLQNLGYMYSGVPSSPAPDLDTIRTGLRALKAAQPGGSPSSPQSGPASSPPESSPVFMGPPPSSSSSLDQDAAPDSGNGPTSAPSSAPSSTPASGSTPASDTGGTDNAGLDDNGTLDDATTQLLLTAYGF